MLLLLPFLDGLALSSAFSFSTISNGIHDRRSQGAMRTSRCATPRAFNFHPAISGAFRRRNALVAAVTLSPASAYNAAPTAPTPAAGLDALREDLERRGLPKESWAPLVAISTQRTVEAGEFLIREGDVIDIEHKGAREVFAIVNGTAQIEVKGKRFASLRVGNYAGEASFVSQTFGPRSATVRAVTPLTVLSWKSGALRAFLDDSGNAGARNALMAAWTADLATKLHKVMVRYDVGALEGGLLADQEAARNYGYRSIVAEEPLGTATPVTAFKLAWWTFSREYKSLRRSFRFEEFASNSSAVSVWMSETDQWLEKSVQWLFPTLQPLSALTESLSPETQELQAKLRQLRLSNRAIAEREHRRMEQMGRLVKESSVKGINMATQVRQTQTPWFILAPYFALCWMLDVVFEDRPLARFWLLETVARMPYFSYTSMLHLYESLGWWTIGSDVRKIHFAQEINESSHLLIMESLGGDQLWLDRFLGRHAAIIYYWILNALFLLSPFLAYNFSELIESHAVDTYSEFLDQNEELLKSLPPSEQAMKYYQSGDMYLFDAFQTARPAHSRRPILRTLYDVFACIRDDELEHVKTMFACERSTEVIKSPNDPAAQALWAKDVSDEDLLIRDE